MDSQLKCDICGRFIKFDDFLTGKAYRMLALPDAEGTVETWETYHKKCE